MIKMANKGQKFKHWTAEEKYKIIEPALNMEISGLQVAKNNNISRGMVGNWIVAYKKYGMNGLTPKRKPGNPICKYSNKKNLTKEEQLEYENMKLRIENEMLKKGFLMKEDGTYVKFMK